MSNTKIQVIDLPTAKAFRKAFGFYEEGPKKTVYNSKPRIFNENGYTFTSTDDVLKELQKFGVSEDLTVKEAQFVLEKWYNDLLKNQSSNETPAPEYVSTTTLTPDQIANFEKDVERIKESEKIRADQKIETERFKKRGEEIFEEKQRALAQKEKQTQELLNQFFKSKVVVIPTEEIPEVKLSKENKETLIAAETAAKEDPATTRRIFAEKIQEALEKSEKEYKESITETAVLKSATHLVEQLRSLPDHKTVNEISDTPKALNVLSILNPLSDPNSVQMKKIIPDKEAREKFAKEVQTLLLATEAERTVNIAGAKVILGEDIAYSLYGTDTITGFQISSEEKDREEGVEISPRDVYEKGKQISDFIEKIRQAKTTEEVTSTALSYYPTYSYSNVAVATKTTLALTKALPVAGAIYGFRQGTLLAHWARYNTPLLTGGGSVPFLTAGGIQNTVLMSNGLSSKILFSKNFATGYSVQVMQFTKGTSTLYTAGATFGNKALGVYVGQAGGKVGAGTIAAKATGQIAVKALPAAVASKIGAFLGSAGGLVGTAVGFIGGELIGKLIEKINWPKVKKWFQENGPVLAGIGGLGGLVLGGPVVGGVILFGGLAATGSLAAFATGAFGVLGFIGRSIGIAIATPVIVTLLIIPPLVAFIMLVINNSAYVVPPGLSSSALNGGADNPYMLVTKIASPNKIDNPSSPQLVIYGVSIKALKESLFNVKITSVKCTVLKKDGKKSVCPDENVPPLDDSKSISPTQVHAFSFTSRYDSKFKDSLVIDSIEVTAELADGTSVTTSGSASLCIGDCPKNCAQVSPNGDPWPTKLSQNVNLAIASISKYQGFTAKLCLENKPINLCYKPSQIDKGKYAWHVSNKYGDNCDVYFNDKGVGSEPNASYMITHELTHHIQSINGNETAKYLVTGYPEVIIGGICTYSSTIGSPTESMAEAAALYVNSRPSWDLCASNYSSKYPKNYNWAKKFMEE